MEPITWVIIGVVLLILLFVVIRILKGCVPKILIGLIILAAIGYFAYWYFTR
jgi:hypothetical protein